MNLTRNVVIGYLCCLMSVSVVAQTSFDYGSALDAAIKFYDANRCGPDAGKDNAFSWRGACHTQDSDGGVDLTGGYHDAGDHVKFGLPQCWSAAVLGWAMYEYPEVFEPRKDRYFRMLKWFTDYFLKCHPSPNVFYYNVGEGNADHGYWGPPEQQTGERPVMKAPPGSDVCALGAAALALMSINYKSVDESYAQKCLAAAKELFELAIANSGSKETALCSDGAGGNFYRSSTHYDDMCWGGIWLYTATGNTMYLDSVDQWIETANNTLVFDSNYHGDLFKWEWVPAWENVILFVLLKMVEITGNDKYYQALVWNLEWFRDDVEKSPYGLPILSEWGPLRYASSEAGLGFLAYKLLGYNGFTETGSFIMDYCLGKNAENRSYITGWGTNPPVHPHHRANEPAKDGSTKGIIGALVGGPVDDSYKDDVNNYIETEVALDYNASFILGLAGHMFLTGGGKAKNRAPSIVFTSPKKDISIKEGTPVNVTVVAEDADGKVTKIELFKGEELLGSTSVSPYTYTLEHAGSGEVTLKAVATDDSGKVSNSLVIIHFDAPCTHGDMLSRTGWEATASASVAGEGPNNPLDGKDATRWASGSAMVEGMWYQVDMGYPRDFDQITIDASGSGTDYPRLVKVYAGIDSASLGEAIAQDSAAAVTTLTLNAPVNARYIRIVCQEGRGESWWSIHELNVRCADTDSRGVLSATRGTQQPGFRFNPVVQGASVQVRVHLPERGRVTIEEYVMDGSRTKVLFDGVRNAGDHAFTRTSSRIGSRVALYKIRYNGYSEVKKVFFLQ